MVQACNCQLIITYVNDERDFIIQRFQFIEAQTG